MLVGVGVEQSGLRAEHALPPDEAYEEHGHEQGLVDHRAAQPQVSDGCGQRPRLTQHRERLQRRGRREQPEDAPHPRKREDGLVDHGSLPLRSGARGGSALLPCR